MTPDREQLIRDRAYEIWQAEGCPDGREAQHWQQAVIDMSEATGPGGAEEGSAAAPARKPAARRKPADATKAVRSRKPKV